MKYKLFILLLISSLAAHAQVEWRGRVVDAQTGEELPYVSIYASSEHRTLSNAEGNFVIQAMPDDVLRFSCVGYAKRFVKASNLDGDVRLNPLAVDLQEVTVNPIDVEDILEDIIKQLKKDSRRGKKATSQFFSRILFSDYNGRELMEAFMSAKPAVHLHDFTMISGKKVDTDYNLGKKKTKSTNVHRLLEVGPLTLSSSLWARVKKPLDDVKTLRTHYEIEASPLVGDEGERIYKIEFRPTQQYAYNQKNLLANSVKAILWGTLFVESGTHRLLRFDGGANNFVVHTAEGYYPTDMKLHIAYDHIHNFTEVSHISLHGTSDIMNFRALLFNVDDVSFPSTKGSVMEADMINAIREAGYDEELWNFSNIVMRTQEEEATAREMEPDRAFSDIEDYQPSPIVQRVKGLLMRNGNMIPLHHIYKDNP